MNGLKTALCCVASAAIGALIVYGLNTREHSDMTASSLDHPTQEIAAEKPAGKKVLYWYDPMVPGQHFDKPGKSPFMDMELVPRYAETNAVVSGVRIDAGLQQSLALRRARVERKVLERPLDIAGTLRFNERNVAIVQARSVGFVERVYARAPGDVIDAHAPLADVLMPEWAGAQAEFLAIRSSGDAELVASTRLRLRWMGMTPDFIAGIERSGQVQAIVTIASPIAGVVRSLSVREGMTLDTGTTLAEINGIDPVWLEAAVPEVEAARVQTGQALRARLLGFPNEDFSGHISAIIPNTEADSRTLTVRAEFENAAGRLRPGMLAQVRIDVGDSTPRLWVPVEAVIRTGRRTLVILEEDSGSFAAVEVELGTETQTDVEVRRGLEEGQTIVASGQFLLESEASLSGLLRKLEPAQASGGQL